MNLKKVLGAGGQGVACLFERTEADGSKRAVVVKASLNGNEVERETATLRVSPYNNTHLWIPSLEAVTNRRAHSVIGYGWREPHRPAPVRA